MLNLGIISFETILHISFTVQFNSKHHTLAASNELLAETYKIIVKDSVLPVGQNITSLRDRVQKQGNSTVLYDSIISHIIGNNHLNMHAHFTKRMILTCHVCRENLHTARS